MLPLQEIYQQIKKECDERSPIDRVFSDIIITPTSELAHHLKSAPATKKFRPSKPFAIFSLLFTGFMLVNFLINLSPTQNGWVAWLLMLVFFTGLFFVIVRQFFFDDSVNFRIQINNKFIQIAGQQFNWSDTRDTAIMAIPHTKGYSNHLLIILNNGEYYKYDLNHILILKGTNKTLSTYIEFYKSGNKLLPVGDDPSLI